MRILLIHAHPAATSFVAALHRAVKATLTARGHEIDDLDLYAEKFDPVMSSEAFAAYGDVANNTRTVETYVARLRAAEAMALTSPIWFDGMPAILQGYFQRVFLPGVAFTIDEDGKFHANLHNIRRLAAVCTYGSPEQAEATHGDPPKQFICDHIGSLIAPDAVIEFYGHYGMNFSTPQSRQEFLGRVAQRFSVW